VVDETAPDRFALLGISQGCAVSVAYTVRHPERVSHLVLYGGFVKGWRLASPEVREKWVALNTLIRQGWGQDNPAFRQMFTALFMPGATSEQMRWFNELQRASASPENALRIREALADVDVEALLPKVSVPTLVLHARDDAVVPFKSGREYATGIPGAQFVPLEGQNHLLIESEPAWPRFLSEVRAFLANG
jgi:pimeloyl-ACP methyl ester carboxylesterase